MTRGIWPGVRAVDKFKMTRLCAGQPLSDNIGMKYLLATFFALLLCAAPTRAAESASAPATSPATAPGIAPSQTGSRLIKTFDFDEKKLGNFDSIPMFWNKVGGRGYPLYTGGQFDDKIFRSPASSFRLDLDGGSVAYQFQAGQLKANPNADYMIIGFVKTTALAHARAEITAWFADADNKVLTSTEVHSERWASPDGQDDWHVVHLFISGTNPAISSLVLQVGLLQPQQLSGGHLGKFEIFEQDIKGSAWFDDIAVFELPRLAIKTTAVGGIFPPHKPAEVEMVVSDVNHAPLNITLTVRDAAGTVAHRQQWPIQPTPETPWQQKVTLPALPPGLYSAGMEIADAHGTLTRRDVHFACTGELGLSTRPTPDFGVVATNWPVGAWDELPTINAQIGTGLIKIPIWRKDMTDDSLLQKDAPFDNLLAALQRQEVLCTAAFSELPAPLAGKAEDALSLFETDPAIWRPYINFILARNATRVENWQVGSVASRDARFARQFARARTEISSLVNSPRMVIPWNAMYEFDAAQFPGASVELLLPNAIKPQQIPTYIQSLTQNKTPVFALVEPLEESKYSRADRLTDFAQRVVLARTTAAKSVLVDLPMSYHDQLGGHLTEPTELLVVFRTMARELGGATFRQELPLEPGIRALLFDNLGGGTLILWNEHAADAQVTLQLPLGKNPGQVDLNGRVSPIALANGIATLSIGTTPVIITNVDTRLAQLRGGFALGQNIFPAGAGTVATTIKLHNPYREPISGNLHLSLPQGWTADPPSMPIALAPGGDLNQPVTIRYPFNEFAGPKIIKGRLTIDGDGESAVRSMDVMHHITLASDVVEMECLAHFMPTGELVILQTITNTSNQPLNAQAYAMVPGLPRQQRFVLDLQPSQSVIKRFIFPNAGDATGKIAAAGIRQNDGTTLLTRSVPLN